jgi:hypothetical protein
MKNTKEMQAILTAIYCINQTGSKDEDITNLCEYVFTRCTNVNFRFIGLHLINQTKEQIMPEVNKLIDGETNYKKYMENKKK